MRQSSRSARRQHPDRLLRPGVVLDGVSDRRQDRTLCTNRNNDGAIGYYSVIYVKPRPVTRTFANLKGKNIGFVDPNSTSGYHAPRFYLQDRIDADDFLRQSLFVTGSHENAGHRSGEGDRRLRRKLVECPRDDIEPDSGCQEGHGEKGRISGSSSSRNLLPGSPYAVPSSLPDDLKKSIQKAFMEAPTKDKAAFDRLSNGKTRQSSRVSHTRINQTTGRIDPVSSTRCAKKPELTWRAGGRWPPARARR